MAYPTRLLTDDEEIVREFHPHWRVLLLAGTAVVVALAATVLALTALEGAARWIVLIVAALIAVVFSLPRFVSWRFKLYVLTTERIVVRDGVISRGSTEIPLENINHVLFTQSVIERLLGYGDVLIESASAGGQSRLTDIPDPEEFQSEVYRVRETRALALQGSSAPRDAVAKLASLADLHDRGVLSDDEFAVKKAKLLDEI